MQPKNRQNSLILRSINRNTTPIQQQNNRNSKILTKQNTNFTLPQQPTLKKISIIKHISNYIINLKVTNILSFSIHTIFIIIFTNDT
jgi:hypothetical protein